MIASNLNSVMNLEKYGGWAGISILTVYAFLSKMNQHSHYQYNIISLHLPSSYRELASAREFIDTTPDCNCCTFYEVNRFAQGHLPHLVHSGLYV